MADEDHVGAHRRSSGHRGELERSELCGCFFCLAIFSPAEILEWTDDGQTAICPKCGVDTVIGSASDYPVTIEFLQRMKDHWFSELATV